MKNISRRDFLKGISLLGLAVIIPPEVIKFGEKIPDKSFVPVAETITGKDFILERDKLRQEIIGQFFVPPSHPNCRCVVNSGNLQGWELQQDLNYLPYFTSTDETMKYGKGGFASTTGSFESNEFDFKPFDYVWLRLSSDSLKIFDGLIVITKAEYCTGRPAHFEFVHLPNTSR